MSQPIDVAYVEVRPDVDNFATRLTKQLSGALNKVQANVDRSTARMSESFTKAGKAAGSNFGDNFTRDADGRLRAANGRFASAGAGSGRAFGDGFIRDINGRLRDALGRFASEGDHAGTTFGKSFTGGATPALSSLAGTLGSLGSLGPIPAIAGIAAAAPAVIALGGALVDLSGALLVVPAGIGVLAAAIAPLAVSFHGFGDAVKALATGDLDKIKEAMKGLAPAAQGVAREINALSKPLDDLKKRVQQSFFGPLQGDLTRLGNVAIPVLRRGMVQVGDALGHFGSQLLDLLGQPDILNAIGDVFRSTAGIVKRITPQIIDLIGTLFGVMEHGLPFVERAFGALGRGLESITGFLSGSLKDGSFEGFIQGAFNTLKDLGNLAKSIFDLLGALFGNAGDEGRTFIQTLTSITDQMTAFLKSADGQAALQRLLDTLPLLLDALKAGLTVLGAIIVGTEGWYKALEKAVAFVVSAGKAIGGFFADLGRGTADVAGAVGRFFVSVGQFFADLGAKIAAGFTAVTGFVSSVVGFFTSLPGRILAGLQALPGLLLAAFNTAFDAVFYAIGFGIGTVVGFFLQLPGRVWAALTALPGIISTVFTTVRDVAISAALTTLNAVVGFFTQLPGRVWGAITGLVGRVASVFNSARGTATSTASGIVSSVVGFFQQLPGRVGSAISGLPGKVLGVLRGLAGSAKTAGGDIIRSIIDGVNGLVDWAVGQAKRAVNKIVQGIKDALPGSPVKEGPLTVLNNGYAGRQIVKMLVGGIEAGAPDVRGALDAALAGGRLSAQVAGTGPVGAAVLEGGGASTQLAAIINLLTQIAAQEPSFNVRAQLGTREIQDIIGVEVQRHDKASARRLAATPRIP